MVVSPKKDDTTAPVTGGKWWTRGPTKTRRYDRLDPRSVRSVTSVSTTIKTAYWMTLIRSSLILKSFDLHLNKKCVWSKGEGQRRRCLSPTPTPLSSLSFLFPTHLILSLRQTEPNLHYLNFISITFLLTPRKWCGEERHGGRDSYRAHRPSRKIERREHPKSPESALFSLLSRCPSPMTEMVELCREI